MRARVLPASLILLFTLLVVAPERAMADGPEARAWFDKATAAYGLGNYAEAADDYEKAYSLHPDPALLYNAAQSHRLANNDARALLLYRNYLRIYRDASNRDEVKRRIAALEAAPVAPSTAPPTVAPAPVVAKPVEVPVAPVVTPTPAPTVEVAIVAPPPRAPRPVYKKAWFWGVVVGSAVVVGVGLGVGLGLGLPGKAPNASFGHVDAN